jgi:hypothetical protein
LTHGGNSVLAGSLASALRKKRGGSGLSRKHEKINPESAIEVLDNALQLEKYHNVKSACVPICLDFVSMEVVTKEKSQLLPGKEYELNKLRSEAVVPYFCEGDVTGVFAAHFGLLDEDCEVNDSDPTGQPSFNPKVPDNTESQINTSVSHGPRRSSILSSPFLRPSTSSGSRPQTSSRQSTSSGRTQSRNGSINLTKSGHHDSNGVKEEYSPSKKRPTTSSWKPSRMETSTNPVKYKIDALTSDLKLIDVKSNRTYQRSGSESDDESSTKSPRQLNGSRPSTADSEMSLIANLASVPFLVRNNTKPKVNSHNTVLSQNEFEADEPLDLEALRRSLTSSSGRRAVSNPTATVEDAHTHKGSIVHLDVVRRSLQSNDESTCENMDEDHDTEMIAVDHHSRHRLMSAGNRSRKQEMTLTQAPVSLMLHTPRQINMSLEERENIRSQDCEDDDDERAFFLKRRLMRGERHSDSNPIEISSSSIENLTGASKVWLPHIGHCISNHSL